MGLNSSLNGIEGGFMQCTRCLRDPEIGPQLRSLPFFLPLPNNVEEPPYTYLFVAMEPSGNWLKTEAEGTRERRFVS